MHTDPIKILMIIKIFLTSLHTKKYDWQVSWILQNPPQVYKMGSRKRRRQLRSLSLPETSHLPRKVSSELDGSVISLKSASWDSVGGKEQVCGTHCIS